MKTFKAECKSCKSSFSSTFSESSTWAKNHAKEGHSISMKLDDKINKAIDKLGILNHVKEQADKYVKEVKKIDSDPNTDWINWKNKFAQLEREQEEKAYENEMKHDSFCDRPMSLQEYASIESGFPQGSQKLTNYINRYYGHS